MKLLLFRECLYDLENFRNRFADANDKLQAEERLKVNGFLMFYDPIQPGAAPFGCFTTVAVIFFQAIFEKEEEVLPV